MKGPYYKNKESVEEYTRLAKDVNGSKLIHKLTQFLPPASTILEIGSGPGTDWNLLNKTYNTTGSDNSKEFLNHLASENPSGKFIELDAVSINVDEKFDGIYSNKVLHHLKDNELIDSIKRQFEILNPEGIICHSFWKGIGSEIFKGLFVNYHSEEVLRNFFDPYFEILIVESYDEFEKGDSILILGRKKNNR